MPEGLEIDRERKMNGTMPPYAQHVVIRTGRADWSSKIEDEPHTLGEQIGGGNLARSLKALVGRGGSLHNPEWPVLITNSYTPNFWLKASGLDTASDFQSVLLFPQQIRINKLRNNPASINRFAKSFLVQTSKKKSGMLQERLASSPADDIDGTRLSFSLVRHRHSHAMTALTILICGHASRDTRCGILGPILQKEFYNFVKQDMERVRHEARFVASTPSTNRVPKLKPPLAHTIVGLCSHVGGHVFAGNVVIYLPKKWKMEDGKTLSPLAGKGIWYGRVEPKHVWGIMEETVKKGRLIEELLRGVHDPRPRLTARASQSTEPVE